MGEMSKTPEEIKKGLECCAQSGKCDECSYIGEDWCAAKRFDDTIAYIQLLERDKAWASENYDLIREENKRLEAQNAELLEKIKQLEKKQKS